jgi:hypothetical protein
MKVTVHRGDWSGREVQGATLELVSGLSMGQDGPFITVNGQGTGGVYPDRNFRIKIQNPEDIELEDELASRFASESAMRKFQSDAQFGHFLVQASASSMISQRSALEDEQAIRDRLVERFSILSGLTKDVARGDVKGLVVSGASGVGKSHEVELALSRDSLMDKLSFNADAQDQNTRRISRAGDFKPRYEIIKGYSTAPALYMTLYEYSEGNETLVFDDCDSVLGDEVSLNILKAALDTTRRRVISWKSQTRNSTSAPDQFEFKGGVIFITNLNFEKVIERGTSRMVKHLEAIMSRCLYLDLTIDTVKEKLVRIDHVARDLRMLEDEFKLSQVQRDEVLAWTHQHANAFRELSLRKVGQLASLRAGNPNWQRVAEVTLLRRR